MPLLRRAKFLLLVLALAVSARAGVVAPVATTVYAPPGGSWGAPLGVVFTDPAITPLLPASLGSLSLAAPGAAPTPEMLRKAAPLVHSLTEVLSIKPEALAKMDPATRKNAVELAVEDAKESVRAKAYELSEKARQLSQPGRAMDRATRAELYHTTAMLMEMKEFYGDWLDSDGLAVVDEGYKTISARAWEVRNFLLERDTPAAGPVSTKRPGSVPPSAAAPKAYVMDPAGTAVALRTDMQNNKSGWGQDDLHTLYVGYGFVLREGGKHRFYYHPAFPQLTQSVSRQNDLPPGYAQSALKLITELERLVAAQKAAVVAPTTGPPATLTLADLSILMPQEKPAKIVEAAQEVEEKVAASAPQASPATVPKVVPQPIPSAIAEKTNPDPVVNVGRLQPPTEKVVEVKPEPPPVTANPDKPGFLERVKSVWSRGKTN
ncbi:MAG: hypothetical protein HY923_10760 [Elusimicrobia bacterium]|nr:hypothetical protein [Elusimicrobiota bacterium]